MAVLIMPKLAAVYVFPNGQIAATDRNGQQIPELQGRFTEQVVEVLAAADIETIFWGWPDIINGGHLGDWKGE